MQEGTRLVSCHIFFKGIVQGVGFRYTACRIARSLLLKGFVRNLVDSNVEVQLEGNREVIVEFIGGIKDSMQGRISDIETDWGEAGKAFSDFHVEF